MVEKEIDRYGAEVDNTCYQLFVVYSVWDSFARTKALVIELINLVGCCFEVF